MTMLFLTKIDLIRPAQGPAPFKTNPVIGMALSQLFCFRSILHNINIGRDQETARNLNMTTEEIQQVIQMTMEEFNVMINYGNRKNDTKYFF